jgi:hypothetical protein
MSTLDIQWRQVQSLLRQDPGPEADAPDPSGSGPIVIHPSRDGVLDYITHPCGHMIALTEWSAWPACSWCQR